MRRHERSRSDPWIGKTPWGRAWQPTPVFLLEHPMDGGAWGLQTMGSRRGGRLKQPGMHAGTKWVQIPKRGSSYVPRHATGRQSAVSSWWDHELNTGLSSRYYVLNRATKQNVPREDQQSKHGDVTKETA